MTTPTHIRTTHINATEKYIFSEYDERIAADSRVVDNEGNVIMAELYRCGVEDYGRCTGKVYVDTDSGVRHVGYVYVSRERYEDTGERYLRETWVALIAKSTTYVGAS